MTYYKKYEDCLLFIDSYWDQVIHDAKESQGDPHTIPLPHTFITPNATSHWRKAMFYWDNFFMFRGLINTPREWVITEVLDNLIYLFNTYGIIPNATVWGFLGHSQPPMLTSMIFDAYYSIQRASGVTELGHNSFIKRWLESRIEVAHREYESVWMDSKIYTHRVEKFDLSRYGDRDVGYALTSERESGWDFTTRFYNRCNDFLPVDLNSFLHKYEKDFAKAANILGQKDEEKKWDERAHARKEKITKYMWNEEKGFFFDYDFVNDHQSEFYSLAGFVPLWGKVATYEQAKRAVEKLPLFETEYGLTITAAQSMPPELYFKHIPEAYRYSIEEMMEPKQWDYPHIWAPLEYLTVIGLLRYGFTEDAVRIMEKSVKANYAVFKKYGMLLEKLDATTGEKPKDFWYPSQLGFGWTNGVFHRYIKLLDEIKEKKGKYLSDERLKKGPPYSLTDIIH